MFNILQSACTGLAVSQDSLTHSTVWGPATYCISANERRVCWLWTLRASWGCGGDATGPGSCKDKPPSQLSILHKVIPKLMLSRLYFNHNQAFAFYFIWIVQTQGANIPVSNRAGPLMLVHCVATEICKGLRCVHGETELGNVWMKNEHLSSRYQDL